MLVSGFDTGLSCSSLPVAIRCEVGEMIPVGGPTTASLDRPGDALLADPAEPGAGQSADPRDDQPSGSVFDQPALPRLDQSAESRLDPAAGSLLDPAAEVMYVPATESPLDQSAGSPFVPAARSLFTPAAKPRLDQSAGSLFAPAAKPQLDRAAEPRLDPAPGSLFVPAPKPRLNQSAESRSDPVAESSADPVAESPADPVAESLADPAAEFLTEPTAEPWLDLVAKSLLMPPVSAIEPGSDDRTEPNRTEQTQISPAEYAPASLTKPTQAEPAETRPAETILIGLTEPTRAEPAETSPAESIPASLTKPTRTSRTEPTEAGQNEPAPVGGSSVAAVSSYPVPAWLIRQNVAKASTGKAIVALTAMTLLALVLLGTTVTLAMHGFGADAVEEAAAPVGQLVQPAPAVAGGLPQHYAAEHNPVTQAVIAHFRQRFGVVFADPTAEVAGLYSQPGRVDVVTGLPAWVMYLGVNVSTSPGDLPATVTGMMTSLDGPAAHVQPWRVAAGPAGGIAECVVTVIAKSQMSICGWATDSAIGALASPTRDTSVRELEVLMSQMRPDLQPN